MRTRFLIISLVTIAALGLAGCGIIEDVENTVDELEETSRQVEERNEKRRNATFRVTYRTDDGSEVTFSQEPPKSAYLTEDTQIISDADNDTVITCTGIEGDDPSCLQSDAGFGDDFFGFYGADLIGAGLTEIVSVAPGVDSEQSDAEIAGRDAECVTASLGEIFGQQLGEGDESFTSCWDKETGVVLRYATTGADGELEMSFEATAFGDPESADFEPVAEPETLDERRQEIENQVEDQLDDLPEDVRNQLDELTSTTTTEG